MITHLFATGNASIVELRNVDAMSSILFLMRAAQSRNVTHLLNCKEEWVPSVSQASQEPLLSKRARKTCQDNALHDPASAQPNPSLGSLLLSKPANRHSWFDEGYLSTSPTDCFVQATGTARLQDVAYPSRVPLDPH